MTRALRRRYGRAGADPEVVSTRKTHDGVTVRLHQDGAISNRTHFIGRVKLPTSIMWRVWGDIESYTHEEIPALIKQAKKLGSWPPAAPRSRPTAEESDRILAGQKRTQWFDPTTGVLTYAPGFLPAERRRRQ
jgi:hypothetical protein